MPLRLESTEYSRSQGPHLSDPTWLDGKLKFKNLQSSVGWYYFFTRHH